MANTYQVASVRSQDEGGYLGWDDLRFPAISINPPGPTGNPGWDETNIGWLFDPAATEQLQIVAQMPHGWKLESDIYPHVHWRPTTTNTGNVLWRLLYKWTNDGDVDAGTFTQIDVLQAGAGVALTNQRIGWAAVSGTGKGLSSILIMTLQRVGGDGSDTYTGDALLTEFDIHYQINSIGSVQPLSKV